MFANGNMATRFRDRYRLPRRPLPDIVGPHIVLGGLISAKVTGRDFARTRPTYWRQSGRIRGRRCGPVTRKRLRHEALARMTPDGGSENDRLQKLYSAV